MRLRTHAQVNLAAMHHAQACTSLETGLALSEIRADHDQSSQDRQQDIPVSVNFAVKKVLSLSAAKYALKKSLHGRIRSCNSLYD